MLLSPVTNRPSNVVDSFNVKEIIEGYRKDIGIDVSQYFTGLSELPLYECPDIKMRFFIHHRSPEMENSIQALKICPGIIMSGDGIMIKRTHLFQ